MEKDNEKIAEAMILGHRVLRVTPRQVKNGKAIEWVQKLVAAGGPSAQVKTSSES